MVFSTWWSWLLVLLVLVAVALILFAGRSGAPDPGAVAGGRTVRTTRRIAWIYVATCLVAGLASMAETLWGAVVTVKLPVAEFWPSMPDSVTIETPLARVAAGGFTTATVSVDGLDLQTRLMLAGAELAQLVLAVAAGFVIISLCTAVMMKSLFSRKLIRSVRLLAGVVLLGGMVWQACQLFGGSMAAEQVVGATSWSVSEESIPWTDVHEIVGLPSVSYSWEFNLWFIGAALALMVLAELFRQGGRIQKETAGLI